VASPAAADARTRAARSRSTAARAPPPFFL
jgi:hypothetical protein